MAEIYWAGAHEKDEIIDFIDFVFSKAHRPHDFASLLPKLYGERGDAAAHHIVVREDGKIAATMMAYPVRMQIGDKQLMTLGIGSVSTHPRCRGRGYLGGMMKLVDERAKELGAVFAVLSGQRQRYQYYGYDNGGYQLEASLTADNVRHALKGVGADGFEIVPMEQMHVPRAKAVMEAQPCFCVRSEEAFLDVLRSWNNEPFAVIRNGAFAGFGTLRQNSGSCHVAELLLEDEADFAAVMKLLSGRYGTITACAAPWQRRRARWLHAVCESDHVAANNMYKIYAPQALREACEGLDSLIGFELPLYIAPPDAV